MFADRPGIAGEASMMLSPAPSRGSKQASTPSSLVSRSPQNTVSSSTLSYASPSGGLVAETHSSARSEISQTKSFASSLTSSSTSQSGAGVYESTDAETQMEGASTSEYYSSEHSGAFSSSDAGPESPERELSRVGAFGTIAQAEMRSKNLGVVLLNSSSSSDDDNEDATHGHSVRKSEPDPATKRMVCEDVHANLHSLLELCDMAKFEPDLLEMGATLPEDLDDITDDELAGMGMKKLQIRRLRRAGETAQLLHNNATGIQQELLQQKQHKHAQEQREQEPFTLMTQPQALAEPPAQVAKSTSLSRDAEDVARFDGDTNSDSSSIRHEQKLVDQQLIADDATAPKEHSSFDGSTARRGIDSVDMTSSDRSFGHTFAAGVAAAAGGEFAAAIVLFEEVLQTRPNDARCAYQLLCCHAQDGQFPQALQWFYRAVEWGLKELEDLKPAQDASLRSIVGLPEFQSLLRTLASQRKLSSANSCESSFGSITSRRTSRNTSSSTTRTSTCTNKRSKRRPSRHSARRNSTVAISSQAQSKAGPETGTDNTDARSETTKSSRRRSQERPEAALAPTRLSWAKLRECKFSKLMELLRARDPPQSVINSVLDAHDPRSAAVRILNRYDRNGYWPEPVASTFANDTASETQSEAAASTTVLTSSPSLHSVTTNDAAEPHKSTASLAESHTTTASSQTQTTNSTLSGSTYSSSGSDTESASRSSSEPDDSTVHPLIQEAADKIWLKMKLDGGQRDRSPAQLFAATREMLAMPNRPSHARLEEEALLLCPIMSIEVPGLEKLVQRMARSRELAAQHRIEQREQRRIDKAYAKIVRGLRDDIDEAIGCGNLEKVLNLQGRVAQAENDGVPIDNLSGAMEQLANYAVALTDMQAEADAAAAAAEKEESDTSAALIDEENDEDLLEVDMKTWYEVSDCAEALARLHSELIYSRPASSSPKMELVLAFDEMFANKEEIFAKVMTTGLRQQALHKTNVEKRSRGTKQEREFLNMGYVVPIGQREFFFSCLTEAEVLKLFDAVRQAYRREWRVRAAVVQKARARKRLPKDQEMARELPMYQNALATLLACDELQQTDEFQTDFKNSVEAVLGAEHSRQYQQFEQSLSMTLRSLLQKTRDAYQVSQFEISRPVCLRFGYSRSNHRCTFDCEIGFAQEGWRRVCATKHPKCAAAVRALARSPAVPQTFRRTVEKELSYALVSASAEQFEELLLGSQSDRLPQSVRKLLSEAMLAFDDEKARLDQLAADEKLKAEERAVTAKLSQDAWKKAQDAGPERREQESDEAKESRRIAKARLRGRRRNLDPTSQVALRSIAEILPAENVAQQAWARVQGDVETVPALRSVMQSEQDLALSPELEVAKPAVRASMTAEECFKATVAGEDKLQSLLGLHIRRMYKAKAMESEDINSSCLAGSSGSSYPEIAAVSQLNPDSGAKTQGELRPKSTRRPRPLSASLRTQVERRTGRKIDVVPAPVDTKSIAAFARRQANAREDAELTVKRLKEELQDAARHKQQQTQAIKRLQTRLEVLKSENVTPNQQSLYVKHDSVTTPPMPTASIAVRTLMPTALESSDPDQLQRSVQVKGCEQALVAAAAGDWNSVQSIFNTVPQSAAVVDSRSATLLHRILSSSNPPLHIFIALLALHPVAIKSTDRDGRLPLHVALSSPNLRQQVALAVVGAWTDAAQYCDRTGQTPLHKALAASLSAEILQAALDAAPVAASLQDRKGCLPLHLACTFGAPTSLLRSLLRINPGGLLVQDANRDTPLHLLFRTGVAPSADAVRVLCGSSTAGAALRVPDSSGDRPMHLAVKNATEQILAVILATDHEESFSELNWKGEAPIHVAVHGVCEKLRTLRNSNSRKHPNMSTSAAKQLQQILHAVPEAAAVLTASGSTALHILLDQGAGAEPSAVALIEELVATCPSAVSTRHPATGESALLVSLRNNALPQVVRLLSMASPEMVLEPDDDGNMPAVVCVQLSKAEAPAEGAGHEVTLQAAARLRTLVNACPAALRTRSTGNGNTPLIAACGCGSGVPLAIISTILELDSSVDKDTVLDTTEPRHGGDSALHLLVQAPKPKMSAIKLVLDACSTSALVTNAVGCTPLHLALQNSNEEVATLLLGCCPAAAGIENGNGEFPLHLALSKSSIADRLVLDLIRACPEIIDKPNKSGHSPLALGLQARPGLKSLSMCTCTGGLTAAVVRNLVSVAFDRVLVAAVVEEDQRAARGSRNQTRSILWKWHGERLLAAANHARPALPINVCEWQISDVSIWIRFVALLPRQDSLSDVEILSIAGGRWPRCKIADCMADAGVDGEWLLSVRYTSDLPSTASTDANGSALLLEAIHELRGLQRVTQARTEGEKDADAVAEDLQLDGDASTAKLAYFSPRQSVVYESLLDTGIALVLEFKEQRRKALSSSQKQQAPQRLAVTSASVPVPQPPSIFDRLTNTELFTGVARFRTMQQATGKTSNNAEPARPKIDRASVRAVAKRVRQLAQQIGTEKMASQGLADALLERAIITFLRCRKLDATDPLPPYNLACCHALLSPPDFHGASYWATCSWQNGMSPMDFAADEDLAPLRGMPGFDRILAAAAEEQGRHKQLRSQTGEIGDLKHEMDSFIDAALDSECPPETGGATESKQLRKLGLLYPVATIPDGAVSYVVLAAVKIQAAYRGYIVRAKASRLAVGTLVAEREAKEMTIAPKLAIPTEPSFVVKTSQVISSEVAGLIDDLLANVVTDVYETTGEAAPTPKHP